FPENGQLPGPMTIRIKTDVNMRQFLGKTKDLYVYYYDNTYKRMVPVQAKVEIGEDQYFEFTIYHCSDYVLSTIELPEQLMTPENVRWTGTDKTTARWDPAGGAYYDLELRVEHGADIEERSFKVNGTSKDLKAEIGKLFALFKPEKPDEITAVKFRVRANDGDDEIGEDSEWTEFTADSGFRPVVLDPPSTLSWNGTEKTTASWNEVPNADSYYVLLRVDYGGAHKQTSIVTRNTSVELKGQIDRLFDTIEDESKISNVSYRIFSKPSNDGLFLKSDWSGYSADSGYRRKDEEGETIVKPKVVAVKGKITLAKPSFTVSKWSSANKNIASVNAQGEVTGKKPGEVVITAYGKGSNPDTKNYTVIVEKPVLKGKTLYTTDSFDLEKNISGVSKLIATGYTSSNDSVLEIDDLGYATVKKSGKAKITVSYGQIRVSATYNVKLPYIKESGVSLLESKTKKLTTGNKVKSLTITYQSSDENVAEVDGKGKVKAKAPGTADIFLMVNGGLYDTCKVTVKAPEITNKKDPVELKKKKTYQLKVKNKTKNVSFKSSNEAVVTVTKGGKVKAKTQAGEAYVYLMLNGKIYDKCLFKVE
ncbi:MAG: Ig-like domain-containing protein, partial [Lachnospiraceae bacterium]|nr:Ig-like domain-containing protein [Lachnospiraceae bacterium]